MTNTSFRILRFLLNTGVTHVSCSAMVRVSSTEHAESAVAQTVPVRPASSAERPHIAEARGLANPGVCCRAASPSMFSYLATPRSGTGQATVFWLRLLLFSPKRQGIGNRVALQIQCVQHQEICKSWWQSLDPGLAEVPRFDKAILKNPRQPTVCFQHFGPEFSCVPASTKTNTGTYELTSAKGSGCRVRAACARRESLRSSVTPSSCYPHPVSAIR